MPVLLMAQGDAHARDLLRRAIEARYGHRPPVLESLKMVFTGRARARVGPIRAWVPVEATAYFQFPKAMRWDFTVRPIGVPVQRGIEAFDGETYRRIRRNAKPMIIDDTDAVSSMQRRLWAIAALLLTPLGDDFVYLESLTDDVLRAHNTQLNNAVQVHLGDDASIDQVFVDCLNLDNNQDQRFKLTLEDGLQEFDELILPNRVCAFWDDDKAFEVNPVAVEANPEISEAVFRLENGATASA